MSSATTALARPIATTALLAAALSGAAVAVLPPGSAAAGSVVILAAVLGAAGAIASVVGAHERLLERLRDQDLTLAAARERLAAACEDRARERARAEEAAERVRKLEAQLVAADRHLSVGRLAAGVGHEIANPLAFVAGNLEWLDSELQRRRARLAAAAPPAELAGALDEMTRAVRDALEGAGRVRSIVQQLKTFARGREDEPPVAVNPSEAVEVAIDMARHETKHRARLVRAFGPAPRVVANPVQLAQVFLNLLVNAAHAIPPGAAAANEIGVTIATDDEGWATVAVRDSGSGIADEARARLFEPFFTTKPPGEGSGLGLSISRGIVRGLGGDIRVESAPGAGSTFTVRLPPSSAGPELAGPARPTITPAPRGRRILVVDDEPLVRASMARLLRTWGEVRTAASGREALSLLREAPSFDVVVCDVMMPDGTGIDLYRALEAEAPEQADRFVFVTGGAHDPSAQDFLDRWPGPCLFKPLELEKLRRVVRDGGW